MEITNRVAESDIEVFNLEEYWDDRPVDELDLEPFLVEGLMLREKPFREAVKEYNWSQYDGRHVAVYCSTDAIIPTWAFMLIASKLDDIAASVAFGRRDALIRDHFVRALEAVDWSEYKDGIVVVKGCGNKDVPVNAYMTALSKLQGVARKLMFGEPCSSVPLWRKPAPKKPQNARPTKVKKPSLPTSD